MIEPEIAFCDLPDVMECAEEYVKFCIRYVLDNNITDLEFLDDHQTKIKEKNNKSTTN